MFRLLISLLIVCFSGLWLKPAELAESYQIPTEITGQSSSSLQQLVKPIWLSPLKLKNAAPAWPVVSAQAAAVVDWETGQILWQKNPSQVVTLASLTKLMTALVVLENYWQPQMVVEVPAAAVAANLKSYLQPGDKTSLAELLRILLAASSNEAAETLATQFGREKFIAAMNHRAKTLGLKQAHFVGPSGLEVDNQASLEDVIGLAQIIFGKKEVQAATSQPQGTINAQSAGISKIISFDNTDKLIDESLTVIAGKTGTLDQAGFSVAALVSQTGTRPVLVIILGAKDHFARFAEARNLAEWAWKNY